MIFTVKRKQQNVSVHLTCVSTLPCNIAIDNCDNSDVSLDKINHLSGISWWSGGKGKAKGKASSLDIAPLTILNSGTLQPRK